MMPYGKRIELKDRERLFELASQGLSVRQIAARLGISFRTVKDTLAKGLLRCAQCGRLIDKGDLCSVCSLPANAPFGERLKAFRSTTGFSQERLALTIDVHESTVPNWEKGRRQPAQHEVQLLAEVLGITVQELTGEDEAPQDG